MVQTTHGRWPCCKLLQAVVLCYERRLAAPKCNAEKVIVEPLSVLEALDVGRRYQYRASAVVDHENDPGTLHAEVRSTQVSNMSATRRAHGFQGSDPALRGRRGPSTRTAYLYVAAGGA